MQVPTRSGVRGTLSKLLRGLRQAAGLDGQSPPRMTTSQRSAALLRWYRRMHLSDEGQIVLANLAFDIHERHVPEEFLGRFFQRLATLWVLRGDVPDDQIVDDVDPAIEVFNQVRHELRDEINCLGRPSIKDKVEVSSIMPAKDFMRIINRKRVGGRAYRPIPCESELAELAKLPSLDDVAWPGATMPPQGHHRRIAWVTPTQDISGIRASGLKGAKLAEMLRARLGLIHHIRRSGTDPLYVEVRYPTTGLPPQSLLTPPTVFDAGTSLVYRSQRTQDGWGETIDLHNGNVGLPEAVHLPIPFKGFSIREVGKPGDLVLNISPSQLAKTPLVPWAQCCVSDIERACSLP